MSDQDERKHHAEGQESAPEQQPRETPPATTPEEEKDNTISLLDLMRETTGSEEPGLPEEDTAEIPTPLFATPPEEDDPNSCKTVFRERVLFSNNSQLRGPLVVLVEAATIPPRFGVW